MLNSEKDNYEKILIPEDKLMEAIESGLVRGRHYRRRRVFRRMAASAAACLFFVFCCANIPSVYANACEISWLRNFIQAFRVGNGGRSLDGAVPEIQADKNSVTITFNENGNAADRVVSYSASCYYAPMRLQIVFHGIDSSFYPLFAERIGAADAAEDVYQIQTGREDELGVAVVLKDLYQYELMEFSDPGTMTIRFYQDAYYTREEILPDQRIYYLRTDPAASTEETDRLLEVYREEDPVQVKNRQDEIFLRIGQFFTEEEGKKELERLDLRYGKDHDFYLSSELAGNIPEN